MSEDKEKYYVGRASFLEEVVASKTIEIDKLTDSVKHFRDAFNGELLENQRLSKELATAQNELDQLRKVVWWLKPNELLLNRKGWWLSLEDCEANGLDIEAMQREMGKQNE